MGRGRNSTAGGSQQEPQPPVTSTSEREKGMNVSRFPTAHPRLPLQTFQKKVISISPVLREGKSGPGHGHTVGSQQNKHGNQGWVKADPESHARLHRGARALAFLLREAVPGPPRGWAAACPPAPTQRWPDAGSEIWGLRDGAPLGSKESGWRETPQTASRQRVSVTPSFPFSPSPFLHVLPSASG